MQQKTSKFPPKRPDNSHIIKASPKHNWSDYQKAIFRDIANGIGHTVVIARAGSSKTSSLVEGSKYIPKGKKSLFCAFNKHIQEELRSRLGSYIECATIHSLGFRGIKQRFGNVELDNDKCWKIVEEIIGDDYDLTDNICKTVGFCKSNLVDLPSQIEEVIAQYDIDLCEVEIEQFVKYVILALRLCKEKTNVIDYNDMVYFPFVYRINVGKYDYVFIDECLPGPTPILLADGTSKTIKEIVDGKLAVDVLSYDTETKTQKSCKVIGHSKTLNQKPLVKIKVKWSARKKANTPTNFVVCTTGQKVWANGSWILAGDVKVGMTMQVETSAKKSQLGKITSAGKRTLSKAITIKNDHGIMAHDNSSGGISIRGGNGRGLTVPQEYLMDQLGAGWFPEYVVATGHVRDGSGYPTCYKLDIANPATKIGIEIDGDTHSSPKAKIKDVKKQSFLEDLGWTILHLSNVDVIQKTDECLAKIACPDGNNCPIDAMVVSVEPFNMKDYFVYDLQVEDCHNFYANGILVHNCQDLNKAQIELAFSAVKPDGRIIAVMDPRQAIYSWMGADSKVLENLKNRFHPKELKLPICYRCPKKVVELAQTIVPDILPYDGSLDGEIIDIDIENLQKYAKPGSCVLSRTNAPLIKHCMRFLKNGIPANMLGRDIGSGLLYLIKKSKKKKVSELLKWVIQWEKQEKANLLIKYPKANTDIIADKAECINMLCEGASSIEEVKANIANLFKDNDQKSIVLFSSIHKFKGKEADNVFVFADTLRASNEEELNIKYVAFTRSRKCLFLVHKKVF